MNRLSRLDWGSSNIILKNQIVKVSFQATLSQLKLFNSAGVVQKQPQVIYK